MDNTTNAKNIWADCLLKIAPKLSQVSYDIWIKSLIPVTISEDKLILLTHLDSFKVTIYKNYINLIKDIVLASYNYLSGVEVVTDEDSHLFCSDSEIDHSIAVQACEPVKTNNQIFDENYTFENFVVGGSNQIAVAAAKAVATNPGTQHNPLFIYGGVGLGKTHIIHAIGNYILKNNPNKRILYVTTEQFTNEYIESIIKTKDNDLNKQFREKYRNVDVLMLDDIQFIGGKVSTQEALFHTFNDLYQSKRQVIFTSDCHPKDLNSLEERLKSRFQCGLTVDINLPDLETRIAILQRKAFQKKYQVSPVILNYIAEKVDTNIRVLEASLSKVMFYCTLSGVSADNIEVVNQALKDEIDLTSTVLTIDVIVDEVCKYFMVDKKDLLSKKKTKQISNPRQVAIYLVYELLAIPLTLIGEYFGGRDHSTIIHARDKVNELKNYDPCFKLYVNDLLDVIKKKK